MTVPVKSSVVSISEIRVTVPVKSSVVRASGVRVAVSVTCGDLEV